jgi:hypothetical protein
VDVVPTSATGHRKSAGHQMRMSGDCLFDRHVGGPYNNINQSDSTDEAFQDDWVDGDFHGWFR